MARTISTPIIPSIVPRGVEVFPKSLGELRRFGGLRAGHSFAAEEAEHEVIAEEWTFPAESAGPADQAALRRLALICRGDAIADLLFGSRVRR